MPSQTRFLLSALVLVLAPLPAWAQNVALTGIMGQRALLVIDGGAPAVLSPGDSRDGVTLISVESDRAVVELQGRRQSLRVGDQPVSVPAAPGSTDHSGVVLTAGPGGHFFSGGQIHGASVRFLVDTGSTEVAMGPAEAGRHRAP